MDELIKELLKLYPTTKFMKSFSDGNHVLLYDNENLEWDEEFKDTIIELIQIHLTIYELEHFCFVFDYLNEIEN